MADSCDPTDPTCPLEKTAVVDLYFMEHRAKLIDIAAFLDRVDRAAADADLPEDFRVTALKDAAAILTDGKPHRARRMLEAFSDHSTEPIDKAPMKGAHGVVEPGKDA